MTNHDAPPPHLSVRSALAELLSVSDCIAEALLAVEDLGDPGQFSAELGTTLSILRDELATAYDGADRVYQSIRFWLSDRYRGVVDPTQCP